MKMNPKDILVPAVSLFVIALVATLFLAVVNSVTADKIAEQARIADENARKEVMADAATFEPAKLSDGSEYFVAKDASGNTVGYVFNTIGENKGYGGDVAVTVGINTEGVITGIKPGDISNETPGLGQNAGKDDFRVQFAGEKANPDTDQDITVVKSNPEAAADTTDGQINALTSATITSKAVTGSVNKALNYFDEIGGADNG